MARWTTIPGHHAITAPHCWWYCDTFGIGYRVAALALTIVAGFTLAYVLHRLFIGCLNWRDRGIFDTRALVGDESRNRLALWAVAVYAFSMASPRLHHRLRGKHYPSY